MLLFDIKVSRYERTPVRMPGLVCECKSSIRIDDSQLQIMIQVICAGLGRNIVWIVERESQLAAGAQPVSEMIYGLKHFCFAGVSKDRRSDYVIEPRLAGIGDGQVYDTCRVELEVVAVVKNEVGPGIGFPADLNGVS